MNARAIEEISGELNESLSAEPPAVDALEQFGAPLPDVEVVAFLQDEGLDAVLPGDFNRADLDVWVDRWLAAMASLEAQVDENEEVCRRRVSMIRDHFDGLNATLKRRIDFIRETLLQVTRGYPWPDKKRTRELPHGTLKTRTVPANLQVVDEEAAMLYAKEVVPDAVELVEKLDKRHLKLHWEATGVLPSGCTEVPEETRAYVTAKGTR